MIDEKGIAYRYLKAQKKRTGLLLFGIILAIALITAIFSTFEALQKFEVVNASGNGIWHIAVKDCTPEQVKQLESRADVSGAGTSVSYGDVVFGNSENKLSGQLTGCGEGGAKQLNIKLKSGKMPSADNEIAIEQWVLNKIARGAKIGDSIPVAYTDGTSGTYILSGILKDNSDNKLHEYAGAAITLKAAQKLANTDKVLVSMRVKDGVSIKGFVKSIEANQGINKDNVIPHNVLIGAEGRSESSKAIGVYTVAAVLALLVIIAAITMIYNSFNISVTQRVRQFGLLRALGATPKQLKRVVKNEALFISLFGILPGLILGVLVTAGLITFLKIVIPEYYGPDCQNFIISPIAIIVGAATGLLTTAISSLLPSRKAGKISPVEAMSDARKTRLKKKTARGITTRLVPVEAAITLRQASMRKRSFILTSVSLSFGIILMLCFGPVLDLLNISVSQEYDLGDIYVTSQTKDTINELPDKLSASISKINGVAAVDSVKFDSVDATFNYSMLGGDYKSGVKSKMYAAAGKNADGTVKAPYKSALVGLSDSYMKSLNSRIVFGTVDPAVISRENGVVLSLNYQGQVNIGDLRDGQKIKIGSKEYKICGIMRTNMLADFSGKNAFLSIYTTDKVFEGLSSAKTGLVMATLKSGADGDAVLQDIKSAASGIKNLSIGDMRDNKNMSNKLMLVCNVFIFGFLFVIAFIGILNIVNTVNTNIIVRTRELGLLRAGGMTMGQVTAMVTLESVLYGLLALAIGLAAGLPLNHWFFTQIVKNIFDIPWALPMNFLVISCAVTLAAVLLALIMPLKAIKRLEVTEAISAEG